MTETRTDEPPRLHRPPGRARAAVVAIALLGAATGAPARAEEPQKASVGLVISGGVSEGAYQAGVTYALMKYLVLHRKNGNGYPGKLAGGRRPASKADRAPGLNSDEVPVFEVAAGASAGNINSFLAALTWCASDSRTLKPRENLFWDSWINVGWDKLSPADPRGKAYKKLFEDSLSTGEFRKLDPKVFGGQWSDGESVYTADDGLVTRAAFAAVQENLRRRLEQDTQYRECVVRVGLTATRARAAKIFLGQDRTADLAADRYVVPLEVKTTPTGAIVRNAEVTLNGVGLALTLPLERPNDPKLGFNSVVTLLKASSAFPIAFGPVPMAHCVRERDTKAADDVVCSKGWLGTRAPFIDGGIFDNQPFGLAYALATNGGAAPILFYVDTQPVRHAVVARGELEATNGIALVTKLLGARIAEARGYENLAAATDQAPRIRAITTAVEAAPTAPENPAEAAAKREGVAGPEQVQARQTKFEAFQSELLADRAPQLSSRFFPIVGNRLIDSFGAFMHPSFRVHDYFVGVYDGVFTIAQALELTKAELWAPVSERRAPTRETFENVARALIDGDEDLSTFVANLFEYERFWTGVAGAPVEGATRCHLTLARPPRDTGGQDENVARVFEHLCEDDSKARNLQRRGDVVELTRQLASMSDFQAVAKHVPDLIGDMSEWSFATQDRAVRRAIDVERSASNRTETSHVVEYALLSSRYLAAASIDRGREIIDLDPSTVERISGGTWPVGRFFWSLFPYYLAWDSVHSRASVGWEPKLRFTKAFYATVGADIGVYTHETGRPIDDGSPTKWELRTTLFGLGVDPEKRMFDDLQLAATMSSPLGHPTEWRSFGLELAIHPFGGKFRLAAGLPQAFHHRGGVESFSDRLSAWFVSIGLSDLNGSLYWAGRSLLGLIPHFVCEDYCNGPS